MRATRRVLIAKTFYLIAKLAQCRRGRSARQAAADNDDLELAPIIRANEPRVIAMIPPFLVEWTGRNLCVQRPNHISQNSKFESRNPKQQ